MKSHRKIKWRVYGSVIHKHRAVLVRGMYRFRAEIGAKGFVQNKREGDLKTPIGTFKVIDFYYRAGKQLKPPRSYLAAKIIRPDMGWCDDPKSIKYNRPVSLPFSGSHELLFREDALYNVVGVFDANISPTRRDRGSAIFLHCMRDRNSLADGGIIVGTAGCLALKPKHLKILFKTLNNNTYIKLGR